MEEGEVQEKEEEEEERDEEEVDGSEAEPVVGGTEKSVPVDTVPISALSSAVDGNVRNGFYDDSIDSASETNGEPTQHSEFFV